MRATSVTVSERSLPVHPPLEERKAAPIKWFAALGLGCLIMQVYVFGRWILSDNFTRTGSGSDPIPGWMVVAAHLSEVLGVVLFLYCVYRFVALPWKRERTIGVAGMICLGLMTVYWLDLGANYLNHSYTWSTAFWFNRGAWYNFIPGWVSPRAEKLAEPVLFAYTVNVWAILLPILALAAMMRKAKMRWPRLGKLGLIGICLAVAVPFDFVLEGSFVRLGLYTFSGTVPSLTFFQGHYYQFPVYEAWLAGAYYTFFASLLYFRDDKGRSVVERGIDDLRGKPGRRGVVRFLAWAGACNLAPILYCAVWAFQTMLPTFQWNQDTVKNRSYLRDEVCGAGTPYACPGAGIPVPRIGGAHVSPNGTLVVPDNAKLVPSPSSEGHSR